MRRLSLLRCSDFLKGKQNIFAANKVTLPQLQTAAALGSFREHNVFKSLKFVHVHKRMVEWSPANEFYHLNTLFSDLNKHAAENADYFHAKPKNPHNDFTKQFQTIVNVLDPLQIALEAITSCCGRFDVSPTCKGNGYRSVIAVVEACLIKVLALCQQVQKNRDKFFFRSYHVYMELNSYVQVLTRLLTIVHLAIVLMDFSEPGSLFPHDDKVDELMVDVERINRECFYGRSFGFQYADSIQQALQVVAVAMAAYGDGYIRHNHSFARALSSMLHSGKYVIDPELRARRIAELTQDENIDFCKAFWSLTEEYGVQHAPLLVCPAMAINNEFMIPKKTQEIQNKDGKLLTVELPYELDGIKARLLSYVWRDGQSQQLSGNGGLGPKPSGRSRYLMFHCHGGGFVAQSSKSHEMYLRYWAKELKMPILSIDYSLAPDAPYPQAMNEVYFAYVWTLNNLHALGSFGEKIVFSGDSAGANLVTSVCLKAIENNIRLPDSIVVAYPPYRIQYMPSPSRLLCLMDPLLPVGVLKSCIKAYTGGFQKQRQERVNSMFYSGGNYNAYDVSFNSVDTWFPYNQFHLNHTHSFSETKLSLIKEKLARTDVIDLDDSDTFYSDFPCSSTDSMGSLSSLDSDCGLTMEIKRKNDKNIEAAAETINKISKDEHSKGNILTSLKDKMQTLTSGMTNYLTSEKVEQKHSSNDDIPYDTDISNCGPAKFVTENSENVVEPESKVFTICKECLQKSTHCRCPVNSYKHDIMPSHKTHKKPTNLNFRSSQHHTHNENDSSNTFRKYRSASFEFYTEKFNKIRLDRSKSSSISSFQQIDFDNKDVQLNTHSSCPDNNRLTGNEKIKDTDLKLELESKDSYVMYNKENEKCTLVTPENEFNKSSVNTNTESDDVVCHVTEAQDMFLRGKDPFLSPFMAPDDMLVRLPPITVCACALDPLFDDSVEFIRKLNKLQHKNAELFVLERLPHGFLNFQVFSTEARDGCDLLVTCIKKSLGMGANRIDSSMNVRNGKR